MSKAKAGQAAQSASTAAAARARVLVCNSRSPVYPSPQADCNRPASQRAPGFRSSLRERSGQALALGAKKQPRALAPHAMESLAPGLGASYKSYPPVPSAVWKEMHRRSPFAEREAIAAEPGDAE